MLKHKAKLIQQIASCRKNYRGKNPAGGRKCIMIQSKDYRNGPSVASQWTGYGKWINNTEFTKN